MHHKFVGMLIEWIAWALDVCIEAEWRKECSIKKQVCTCLNFEELRQQYNLRSVENRLLTEMINVTPNSVIMCDALLDAVMRFDREAITVCMATIDGNDSACADLHDCLFVKLVRGIFCNEKLYNLNEWLEEAKNDINFPPSTKAGEP